MYIFSLLKKLETISVSFSFVDFVLTRYSDDHIHTCFAVIVHVWKSPLYTHDAGTYFNFSAE